MKYVLTIIVVFMLLMPLMAQDSSVILEDDFSDPASGWEVGEYDNIGSIGYGDGYYSVISSENGQFMWGLAGQNFSDIVIDIETVQALSPKNGNNGYGVMCRVQDNDDGYVLRISGDGYAAITKIENGEFIALVDWTAADAIIQGDGNNQLNVVCNGDSLMLYVNGELVAEAADSTFAEGDIGLAVTTFEDNPTEIRFDNIVVMAMGDATTGKPGPKGDDTVVDDSTTNGDNVTPDNLTTFEDDFSDVVTAWEIGEYGTGSVGYGDGYYYVTSIESGQFMWGLAYREFTDIVLDVDATQISAASNDNNGYGVMCRVQPNDDGYVLMISGDGYASIIKIQDSEFVKLVDWQPTAAVILGSETNHLRAICDGSAIELYVNDELAVRTTDSSFSNGDIAMAAITFEAEMTEIHFTNLVVSAP